MRDGGSAASAPHTAGLRLTSSGREVMPALGPSWASCVDVRIFLSRPEIRDAPAPADPTLVRLCRGKLKAYPPDTQIRAAAGCARLQSALGVLLGMWTQ